MGAARGRLPTGTHRRAVAVRPPWLQPRPRWRGWKAARLSPPRRRRISFAWRWTRGRRGPTGRSCTGGGGQESARRCPTGSLRRIGHRSRATGDARPSCGTRCALPMRRRWRGPTPRRSSRCATSTRSSPVGVARSRADRRTLASFTVSISILRRPVRPDQTPFGSSGARRPASILPRPRAGWPMTKRHPAGPSMIVSICASVRGLRAEDPEGPSAGFKLRRRLR